MDTEQPQGATGVTAASSARIIRNQSVEIAVTITAGEATGPVTISVDSLPAGVTAEPVIIEPGATSALLSFVAGPDIALGTHAEVMVRATVDGASPVSTSIGLRLTDKAGALDVSFANTDRPSGEWQVANTYSLTRYDASGAVDPTFGIAGTGTVTVQSRSPFMIDPVVLQRADGSLLFATTGSGGAASMVSGFTSDGAPLLGYGNVSSAAVLGLANVGANLIFGSMVAAPDGGVYVASGAAGNFHVARLDAWGALDTSFDGDGYVSIDLGANEWAQSIAVRPDGHIVVAGRSTTAHTRVGIAQITATGALDPMFSGDGKTILDYGSTAYVHASGALADGGVVILTQHSATQNLVFIDANGTINSKTTEASFWYKSLVIEGNDIYGIGGRDGGVSVAKFQRDGAIDPSFGVSGFMTNDFVAGPSEVGSAAVRDDLGRLVVAGMARPGMNNEMMLTRIWL